MRISTHWALSAMTIFILLLTCTAALGQGPIEVEAISGTAYGVGRISIRFPKEAMPVGIGARGISVWEANNRILYPTVQVPADNTVVKNLLLKSPLLEGGPVRRGVAGILQDVLNQTPQTTVYFLFRGDGPLNVTLQTRGARRLTIVPRDQPHTHARLLRRWWKQLNARPGGLLQRKPDYPPIVKNYIQSMLSVRLGLELPDAKDEQDWWTQIEEHLGLFLGTESVLLAAERDRMTRQFPPDQKANLPLPRPMPVAPLEMPAAAKDVKIEPIAKRVPAQCLYVRFGNYANFLWMQDTLKKWGGDLGNLVALRGLDHESSQRMEKQLVLKQTALGRMLGGTVISDVAIIGTDMFMQEGAAYGILFEARNAFLLDTDFSRQRKQQLDEDKSITAQTVEIAGRKVSYLSNPQGTVRSYYLSDEGYILVTTCKEIMRQFIETGLDDAKEEQKSLAATPGFRHARSVMPLARDDNVFVYLSDEFFRNMAGPRYWITMARRLQAAADIQLAELAVLAARGENMPASTIDELIAGGFLPTGFQDRPAGNRTILEGDTAHDSLFGHFGSFTPIPDVPLDGVSPQESAAYARFVKFYREKWGRLDPMIVGIRRHELPNKQERVVIDAQANPFARSHFETVSRRLGPADRTRIAPVEGDIMFIEAQLTDQRIFAGLQDVGIPFNVDDGQFSLRGGLFNSIVGYIGTTGRLGLLSILNQLISSPSDAGGYAGSETGLWRHQDERFTVFSFQPQLLGAVCPQLHFEEAQRPAQIRVRIKDVARARITPTLNALGHSRTRETSMGNVLLMHQLAQQFHVPGRDCLSTANRLLGAKLICPLGGKYEYVDMPDGLGYWQTTGTNHSPERLSPPLNWFRGLRFDATLSETALSAHVEITMQLP